MILALNKVFENEEIWFFSKFEFLGMQLVKIHQIKKEFIIVSPDGWIHQIKVGEKNMRYQP